MLYNFPRQVCLFAARFPAAAGPYGLQLKPELSCCHFTSSSKWILPILPVGVFYKTIRSEPQSHAAEDRGARHRVARVDLVGLVEQVLAADKEVEE